MENMELLPVKEYRREPLSLIFSKQSYTALEKDISTIFLANLPSEKEAESWNPDKEYIFSFDRSILSDKRHNVIKKALEGLNRKRVEVIDDKNKVCIFSSIYPETKIENGIITIHMRGKYIKPYTAITNGYGGWFIEEYMTLERATHKRIFEMCCSAVNKKINRLEIEIKLFKEQIGIGDKYKNRNSECFSGAIAPAIAAIEEKTSLKVDGCLARRGRSTVVMLDVFWKEEVKKKQEIKSSDARQMTIEEAIAKEQSKGKEQELKHAKEKLQHFEFSKSEEKRILEDERERQIFTAFCGRFKSDLGVETKKNMRGIYLKFLAFCKGKEFHTYPEVMDRAKLFDERLANKSL